MKAVKTLQKYKCDFCKRRSVKSAMIKHERICWRNPNRFCDNCNNTGKVKMQEDIYTYEEPCHYCAQRDPKVEEAIKKHYETVG